MLRQVLVSSAIRIAIGASFFLVELHIEPVTNNLYHHVNQHIAIW